MTSTEPNSNMSNDNDVTSITRAMTAPVIKHQLDARVFGQEDAKVRLSQLLAMHLAWCAQPSESHLPPNGLLIGPTGVGKTHTIRTACALLQLPFVVLDATSLVPSGIVGEQVEDVIKRLVEAARQVRLRSGDLVEPDDAVSDADIALARKGVIFIDEFDKLASSNIGAGYEEPIKLVVQRRLLKLIEGSLLRIGVKYHNADPDHYIDTMGILMVGSGAFTGIDSPKLRSRRSPTILSDLIDQKSVIPADVVAYGFIPELVARMPVLINYQPLTRTDLVDILRSDLSPIRLWQRYCETFNKTFENPDDEVLQLIAEQTVRLNMGARGLQQLLFQRLQREIFEFEQSGEQSYRLTVDRWRRPKSGAGRTDE